MFLKQEVISLSRLILTKRNGAKVLATNVAEKIFGDYVLLVSKQESEEFCIPLDDTSIFEASEKIKESFPDKTFFISTKPILFKSEGDKGFDKGVIGVLPIRLNTPSINESSDYICINERPIKKRFKDDRNETIGEAHFGAWVRPSRYERSTLYKRKYCLPDIYRR